MMRKKCAVLFVIFCIGIVFFFSNLSFVTSVQAIQVSVKPRRITTKATYLIELKLEKALEVHDWIKITWPKEAKLPVLPEDQNERTAELKRIIESIYIGTSPCSACQGLPEINYRENSIKFNIHMELNPAIPGYEKVNITVTDRVGVINPPSPGFYKLKISTAKEIESFQSEPFEIVESRLGYPEGIPVVTVAPAGFFQNASYEVRFCVGRGGQMSFNQSRIRIRFPKELRFAYELEKIPVFAIKVNGKPNNNRFAFSEQTITMITPVDIENSGEVTVLFEKEFGIINPVETGSYQLEVSTSEDPEWVASEPFQIENQGTGLRIHPNKTNQKADIQFIVTLPVGLTDTNPLLVEFPASFSMPIHIESSSVSINSLSSDTVSVQKNVLIIYPPENVPPFTPMTIQIHQEAAIRNPKETGKVRLSYKTAQDTSAFLTDEILIEPASFEPELLHIEPSNASSKAQYVFTFSIQFQDGLQQGTSLWIQFPEKSILPANMEPKQVILYGIHPLSITIHPENRVEFVLPDSVKSEELLVLQIDKETGIQNPPLYEKEVLFSAWFSIKPEEKRTFRYQFLPPLPITSVTLTEGIKGKEDWYTQPPVLHLSADQKGVKIFVFWNDEPEKEFQYTQPEKLMSGQYIHKLSYYSVGAYGTEEIQSLLIRVDTVKPSFSLINPLPNGHDKTNQNRLEWSGEVKPEEIQNKNESWIVYPDQILLNDQPYAIDESGHFRIPTDIRSGENHFSFILEDTAGNQRIENRTIFAKFIPPSCTILYPAMHDTVTISQFLLIGKSDPGTAVSFQNTLLPVSSNGDFSIPYQVLQFGKQDLTFTVQDDFGNTTTIHHVFWFGISIVLTIHQKKAMVNDRDISLSSTPFIQSGRTFVPFRFLGEQLGASVRYTVEPKTKRVETISYEKEGKLITLHLTKKTVQVNDQSYPLEPMPLIKNGTTFVPVRLISEYLDCSVRWDHLKQQVTIEYPKFTPEAEG